MAKVIRRLITAIAILASAYLVHAQQPERKVPRIGILNIGSSIPALDAFRQGLHERGWVEGQNIAIEYRFADGNEEWLPALAAQLLHANVDVIVTTSVSGAVATKRLTATIPIVATVIPDAFEGGLVNSLRRPGVNVTGLSFMAPALGGKRLELLKETIRGLSRVAVLSYVTNGNIAQQIAMKEMLGVARALRVQLQLTNVEKTEDIENAFTSMVKEKAEAVAVGTQTMLSLNRTRIVEGAIRSRLPAIYHRREYVEAGGLMSYGPDHADLYRRAAFYVDRILKGAKPEDLPVEQPTRFELVVNLKTAKKIDLAIPSKVLMWADRVIR
jgi:putative ABC transport system substrate-binding protein